MRFKLLPALLLTLALSIAGSAQTVDQGSIQGTVLDPSGSVVPSANLTATNNATGVAFSATTDDTGFYRFPVLPVGHYDLKVTKSGFSEVTRKSIHVTVGSRVTLDLTLPLAGQTATVTVSEEAPLVETTRTQVSSTVNDRAIASLPVNGRNFIDYVLLTPGVTRDVRLGDISFAGQRGTLNSLIVDGSDDNNTFFGQTVGRTGSGRAPYQFSQDSVQEFQVNSNAYSAELGRAGGAVINVVTKSGTNDYHGNGFWYFRDRTMNAFDAIRKGRGQAKAPYHFNQFGANVSGPIAKDKAFFFFNYDGQRNTLPNTVFLNLPVGFTLSPNPTTAAAQQAALTYLTARANSWIRTQNQDAFLTKVDWRISERHLLSIRWNNQRFTGGGFENGGPQNAFEHTGASLVKTDTISANLTSTISSTMVNVARGSFVRDKEPGQANSSNPEALVREAGTTVLTVGRNSFSPRETTIKRGAWSDTLTYLRGHHSWKFGADFIVDRILNFFPGNFPGAYSFASLADFGCSVNPSAAPGCTVSGSSSLSEAFAGTGTTGPTTHPNIFEFASFIQDEWRVRPNLTLNLGVRLDLQKSLRPGVANPVAQAAGINTAQLNTDTNNIGPRVGIAWTPFDSKRLVVRGGYGIFYGRTPSIMVGTAHSNNGINVQTLTFTAATTPAIPSYPNNICGAPAASPSCPAPSTVIGGKPTIFVFSPQYVQPMVHQASAGFEYDLGHDWGIAVSYLGVRAIHLQRTRDINLAAPAPATIQVAAGGPVLTYMKFSSTRPITAFSRIEQFESTANSLYHGLSFQATKRFAHNYQMLASYTFGKVIDDKPDATSVVPFSSGDDAKLVQNQLNTRDDRGRGDNYQKHRFVLSGVWDLKYADQLSRPARLILGGWQLSFILTAQSGQPYSATVGSDLNNDSNRQNDRAPGFGRNTFTLPNVISFDPRITKTFDITERVKLHFFGEAFNAFNRANINGVATNFYAVSSSAIECGTSPTPCLVVPAPANNRVAFGTPTSVLDPRILQISAKISF